MSNARNKSISAGIGFLTGMRGTPIWLNIGVVVAVNEIVKTNPSVLPGQRPMNGDQLLEEVAISALGWFVGSQFR